MDKSYFDFSSIPKSSAQELPFLGKDLAYPLRAFGGQLSMLADFPDDEAHSKYSACSGAFYEILTAGLVNGRWIPDKKRYWGNHNLTIPDVISDDYIFECKSCSKNEKIILRDRQQKAYLDSQFSNNLTISQIKPIAFALYNYEATNPFKLFDMYRPGGLKRMLDSFCASTNYAAFLPLSIISEIHMPINGFPIIERKNSPKRKCSWSRIKQPELKGMIENPENTIYLLGLCPEDYIIQKIQSPEEISVNGVKVNPFPILEIRDKDYFGWLEKSEEENMRRLARLHEWEYRLDGDLFTEQEYNQLRIVSSFKKKEERFRREAVKEEPVPEFDF